MVNIHGFFVFPTHVGMDLLLANHHVYINRFPHTRGDGPSRPCNRKYRYWVFPTHVGMDLGYHPRVEAGGRFPHTRGDGPILEATLPE